MAKKESLPRYAVFPSRRASKPLTVKLFSRIQFEFPFSFPPMKNGTFRPL